jgi:pantoate--beta-alanine ligase
MTTLVSTFAEARAHSRGRVGLVPTMGFFHEGHLSLMERARGECDMVMVSHFVNPLQFDRPDDLAAYPRDLHRDVALAESVGVDLVVAPGVAEMYPVEPVTRVTVAGVSDRMEGALRPGHFAGVATVVAKLFAGLRPDRAYFGRKDAQQLAVVRRMTLDLGFPVEVVGCPLVREADGLALSSRNVRIPPELRERALGLVGGLMAAADLAETGEREGSALEAAAREEASELELDYVELVDAAEVTRLARLDRPAFLAVAAQVGPIRLIDNVWLEPANDGVTADRGARLDHQSVLYR